MVQRGHVFAIVDEVDSILIDEARTPLIISGPSEGETDIYYKVRPDHPEARPRRGDQGQVREQDDDGRLPPRREGAHGLPDRGGRHEVRAPPRRREPLRPDEHRHPPRLPAGAARPHALQAGRRLRRQGRPGHHRRRVHRAASCPGAAGRTASTRPSRRRRASRSRRRTRRSPRSRSRTTSGCTTSSSGMTGTADTEAAEFDKIYKLDVVVIPTNRDMVRNDEHDLVYRTEREKFDAVVEEIAEKSEKGQPVLVGTISIEKSERLSTMLKKKKVPHVVLNAKYHEQEATIVAQAGQVGRRHDRDEHGGPRHGHPPRRQPRVPRDARRRRTRRPRSIETAPRRAPEGDGRGARAGRRARRPPHHRHRAARVPPHRQPAPRPRRPPGRPRLLALLPLARGRPHADLRVRPPLGPHEAPRHGGGRPDRAPLGHEVDRARAEAGRGPQLRHPQAPPRVRRRHEQAARGDLPAPQGDPHRQARARLRRRPRRGRLGGLRRPALPRRARTRPSGTGTPSSPSSSRRTASGPPRRGSRRTSTNAELKDKLRDGRARDVRGEGEVRRRARCCATSRSSSCSRRSTRSGRTTSSASTT